MQKKIIKNKLVNFLQKKYSKTQIKSKKQWGYDINYLASNTIKNIEKWLNSDIPYEFKNSVLDAIYNENWSVILDAFSDEISFGNSSIRRKMTSSSKISTSMINLEDSSQKNFLTKNLQGTNTINPITLLHIASGISHYCKKHNLDKIIIGFDNRLQSKSFAELITNYFVKSNFKVKIFDDVCSTPELAFSVKALNADLGIIITASHNDKRFNGLKIINRLGGSFKKTENNQIIKEINTSKKNYSLLKNFLTNNMPINQSTKVSKKFKNSNLDIILRHEIAEKYVIHLTKFLSPKISYKKNISKLKIGFSATQGTGFYIASKLFLKLGIKNIRYVDSMIKPNPLFDLFEITQTLEPGDKTVHEKTINEFIRQYGKKELDTLDAILFTDPDSDRIGMICKVSPDEQNVFGKYRFLNGNEMWTVVLWHILETLNKKHSLISNKNNLFVVKSFVTSDSLKSISKKFKIKCFDGNVGFPDLSNMVQNKWKKNLVNVSMFEESNGFTIGSHPTIKSNILPHSLEKDGFLGIIKIIETLAFAKSKNLSFYEVLNKIYKMNDIGYYHNLRTQIPEKGSFEHMTDNLKKNQFLVDIKKFTDNAEKLSKSKNPMQLGGFSITKIKKFHSKISNNSKHIFPFEGIRFYFNSNENHLTIRSSNTESKIRLFVQLKILYDGTPLIDTKINAKNLSRTIISDFKKLLDTK